MPPEFLGAHFKLALTCEQLGWEKEAQRHRHRYLPWTRRGGCAAIAREHLAGSGP